MAINKCPICFRPIGESSVWTDDPIVIINGAKYAWLDDTEVELIEITDIDERFFKGCILINEKHIIELQDYLRALEEDILPSVDRTTFTVVNNTGKFQFQGIYIKEMRESVEKLLNALGLTKVDYFNYDEDGNHIIRPNGDKVEWTDPVSTDDDWNKFQIKAIHIEDLRHYIQTLWIEKFYTTTIAEIINIDEYYDGQDESIVTDEQYIDGDKGQWYLQGIVELQISAPLKPPATIIDGYSEGSYVVNITANDSKSHLLTIAATGEAYCSTSYSSGAITRYASRTVSMDNSRVMFEGNINTVLKTTTYIDMESIATLSDVTKCGISCEIVFSSGRSIEYVYGRQIHSETTNREIITLSDFSNLNLPIYNDYINKWGSLIADEKIYQINFYVAFYLTANHGNTETASLNASATKIAVRNS